ncbi:hypothetical protein BGZ63DRAFT_377391 [Mariannaea sp. PMI_226]|nr:hypothetical protein BGZ63DRAFT_377391 [Mariannaea sp. PMI_226]
MRFLLRDITSGRVCIPEALQSIICNYVTFKRYPVIFAEHLDVVESWIKEPSQVIKSMPDGENLPDRLFNGIFIDGQAIRRICSLQFIRLRASFDDKIVFGADPNAIVRFLKGNPDKNASDCSDLEKVGEQLQILYNAHPGLFLTTAFSIDGDDCLENDLPSDELRLEDVVKEIETQKWSETYKKGATAVMRYLDGSCVEFLSAEALKRDGRFVPMETSSEWARKPKKFKHNKTKSTETNEENEAMIKLDVQTLFDKRGNLTPLMPHQKLQRQRQMSFVQPIWGLPHGLGPLEAWQASADETSSQTGQEDPVTVTSQMNLIPKAWIPFQPLAPHGPYPMSFELDISCPEQSPAQYDPTFQAMPDSSGITQMVLGYGFPDLMANPASPPLDQNSALSSPTFPNFAPLATLLSVTSIAWEKASSRLFQSGVPMSDFTTTACGDHQKKDLSLCLKWCGGVRRLYSRQE